MAAGTILVLLERREGETKRSSLEALTLARKLAAGTGGRVVALAFGPGAAEGVLGILGRPC